MSRFKKRFFGKWVLSGEHSVLRGFPAIVYPLSRYYIDFCWTESNAVLKVKKGGKYPAGLEFSFSPLLDRALKKAGKKRQDLKGCLTIEGFIPFGAGLGASAVLSAGIASLFLHKKWITKLHLKPFAIFLEDFFHGKSSGMDVTAVLEQRPLLYQKGKKLKPLPSFQSKPYLFLSHSGGRASTSVSVLQVQNIFNKNPQKAKQIDRNMAQSVQLSLSALKEKKSEKSLQLLSSALSLGEKCFRDWELISYDLERRMNHLKTCGALAVKPTGSGLGGHIISLWNKKPPSSLKDLIPLKI